MTETVLRSADEAAGPVPRTRSRRSNRSTCWAGQARRWKRPTRTWAWRCRTTRSTTWTPSPRPAQPDRRRADDVRAGEQRALPPQDLQRRLDHRRREAGQVAVRMIKNTHQLQPKGTIVAYSDNSSIMEGAKSCASSRAAKARNTRRDRADAHADEGRDPQPPDRDFAVPGRLHRRRRRDPRRGRDRPRRQAEGRPDRLHRVEPDAAGRRAAWENAADVTAPVADAATARPTASRTASPRRCRS
jgi:hypothetical protein